jgi:hypothetical protein
MQWEGNKEEREKEERKTEIKGREKSWKDATKEEG